MEEFIMPAEKELTEEEVAYLKEHGAVELVRCKDCKYLIDHYGFMDDGYCRKMREKYLIKFKPEKENWFCADGERKKGR